MVKDATEEVACIVCKRVRPRGQCHVIELTAKERTAVQDMGHDPLDEYVYCRPCWKNISNPISGPAFMRSLFEILLNRGGVENAEAIAKQFHGWLLKNAKEPKA